MSRYKNTVMAIAAAGLVFATSAQAASTRSGDSLPAPVPAVAGAPVMTEVEAIYAVMTSDEDQTFANEGNKFGGALLPFIGIAALVGAILGFSGGDDSP